MPNSKQPDDLVERLRRWAVSGDFGRGPSPTDLRREAADRIEADAATITELRQRVAELEGERDSYKAALEEQRSYTQEEVEILQRAFASGRLIFEMIDGKTKTERVAIARTALERRGSQ